MLDINFILDIGSFFTYISAPFDPFSGSDVPQITVAFHPYKILCIGTYHGWTIAIKSIEGEVTFSDLELTDDQITLTNILSVPTHRCIFDIKVSDKDSTMRQGILLLEESFIFWSDDKGGYERSVSLRKLESISCHTKYCVDNSFCAYLGLTSSFICSSSSFSEVSECQLHKMRRSGSSKENQGLCKQGLGRIKSDASPIMHRRLLKDTGSQNVDSDDTYNPLLRQFLLRFDTNQVVIFEAKTVSEMNMICMCITKRQAQIFRQDYNSLLP